MISCIICSVNKGLFRQLSINIAETIGTPFEIIEIDNSDGKFGICEAYNKGAESAKYDMLCFIHEDILFETNNWGTVLAGHFASLANAGIIGIAGSTYKSLTASGWWASEDKYLCYHYKQSYKYISNESVLRSLNGNSVKKVICLDGVFLAVKKVVYEKFRFDDSLRYFHGYDLDLSLAVSREFQNYFIPDIMIHHLSEGSLNDVWLKNMFLLFKKWKNYLPVNVFDQKMKITETYIWQNYARLVLTSTLSFGEKFKILWNILYVTSWRFKSLIPLYGLLRSIVFVTMKKRKK
jgi:glycosyltransferase involved in cell wall biosynthesis